MQETSMSSKISTCFSYCRRHSGHYFVCVSVLPVQENRKTVYISLILMKFGGGGGGVPSFSLFIFLKEKKARESRILEMLFNKIPL